MSYEAAAKRICLSENDELCLDAPCMTCEIHAKAALTPPAELKNAKAAWHLAVSSIEPDARISELTEDEIELIITALNTGQKAD